MIADAARGSLQSLAAAWPGELTDLALVAVSEVDSTQRLARTLLDRHLEEDEAPPTCCVLALTQTQGRGRRGRAWVSAPGQGVWATVMHGVESATLPSLPLRAATALAATLSALGPEVGVKWPNDLVVGGRKLGGLLIDTVRRDAEKAWSLVGFGINVGHGESELPTAQATSLRRLGVEPERCELAAVAPACVLAVWGEMLRMRSDWLEAYRRASVHRPGDRIECELEGETLHGELVGFDDEGALRLRTDTGERRVTSGDVYAW